MYLHWLKLWDCVLFRKEKRLKKEPNKKYKKHKCMIVCFWFQGTNRMLLHWLKLGLRGFWEGEEGEERKQKCMIVCFWFQGTNRMLLHWLKLWDCVVFGKEKRVKKEPKKKDNKKQQQQQAFFQKKGILEIEEEMDAHDRPFHKVGCDICIKKPTK